MFKPPIPALAGIPIATQNSPATRPGGGLLAMLPGGVRGRGFGRGAPPVMPSAPLAPAAPPAAPSSTPSGAPMPPSPTEQHAPSGLGAVSGHSDSASMSPEFIEYVEAMGQNIAYLREQMGEMRDELAALSGQGSDSQRVFDALHQELNDYKRDFIYEHMKPLLRPLLFLNDSLEGLDQEMALFEEAQQGVDLGPAAISATKMRQNVAFLRDQLVEALTVCDLEPMNAPVGAFDPKTQKAVDTEVVPPELDGTIVRVIRNGWLMRGHLFRPTEVVLGKSAAS